MDYYDIVFPVSIGALTYRCPEALSGHLNPGMMVRARLKNSITTGIVFRKTPEKPSGTIKDITEVCSSIPVLSGSMIHLLQWMSDYYMAEQGLVLKNILPREVFEKASLEKMRRAKNSLVQNQEPSADHPVPVAVDEAMTRDVAASIINAAYNTFLLHAPSSVYAHSFLLKTIADARNGIILVPEIYLLKPLYALLRDHFGQRVCLFHSELSKGMRREAAERILSSQCDIVLGTRSAVFAPLKKVSFIAVLEEHNSSYKQESSPCYSGRDVAVMRGFFDKATVLLTSVSPSVESLYNCKTGKYVYLKPSYAMNMPRVRILDMRYEKHIRPYLSKSVVETAKKHMANEAKLLFVVNRRGYATLFQCNDCNHVEECPACQIPLVYHKQDMTLKCHYCGYLQAKIPALCRKCKGHDIQLRGAGTQRVQEDIEQIFGVRSVRLDSDKAGRKSARREKSLSGVMDGNSIMIGTKLVTRRLDADVTFSMAAILNADSFLNLPDFRSAEKAYQEFTAVMDKIDRGGEILIQTRMPQHHLFRGIKQNNYELFFQEELEKRKALLYPPFSRLILLRCISRRDLNTELSGNRTQPGSDVEVLGPSVSKNMKGEYEYKLLLKSPNRIALHSAARVMSEKFRNKRDVRVRIDVDPQAI